MVVEEKANRTKGLCCNLGGDGGKGFGGKAAAATWSRFLLSYVNGVWGKRRNSSSYNMKL